MNLIVGLSDGFYLATDVNIIFDTLISKFSFLAKHQNTSRIQMMEVVMIARMVPTGIDFWASRKSPDRFEPAIIPEGLLTGKDHQICFIMSFPEMVNIFSPVTDGK